MKKTEQVGPTLHLNQFPHWTFTLQMITCGKAKCRCNRGRKHGPYWYAHRDAGHGKTISRYIGQKFTPSKALDKTRPTTHSR